ncbi:transcription factor [Halococcus morrhuae DSM 1307]|uniref:TATA-box-binding protein n=1 Tax=Halococcus morrhuae DSM 1307 TaxID=931277 RepID=M0MLS7_HALMO|nr:transcription factor [Halococcus morrhuae DSM 1307]
MIALHWTGCDLSMSDHEEINDPKETLEIQNVVASTVVSQELNLESVAMDLEGADFDRDKFPGVVYRVQDPHAVALIFRSGKIVCTGAGSVPAVHEALEIVFETLSDLGIDVSENPNTEVQNIVTSGDLGERLNLNAIAIGLGLEDVEYEPEQFPGLVYRLDEPDVVALLFGTGKTVIVGGKVPADAEAATEVIVSKLTDLGLFR